MIDLQLRSALLANLGDLTAGDRIAVGLSGGADSVALLRAALHVGTELSLDVAAVIIDHQLQSDSASISDNAAKLATELGTEVVEVIPVDVMSGAGSGGMEAAARNARRTAFELYAGAHYVKAVLLGHTRDDQAETVLLGLARGSGARSLSGMREVDGLYRRPFIHVDRETVRASVSDLAIFEDPHNDDPRFSRVRVRHSVLPVLESELGPGVAQALARTADMLRDDADALDALAKEAHSDNIADLEKLPQAIRTRVIRALLIAAGATINDLTRDHVLAVDALVTSWHGQGPLNLPGAINVSRAHGKLILTKAPKE